MAQTAPKKKKFTWTEAQTLQFIHLRKLYDNLFTGDRGTAAEGFDFILREMGLAGVVTTAQASKKWENLKMKYRDLILPKTGSGTEAGETSAATWPYFAVMHEALGDKDSIKPLNLISSAVDSDNPDGEAPQNPDEETPGLCEASLPGESSPSTSTSTSTPGPSTSTPGPSTSTPGISKRKNDVLEFLKDYTERQEKRQRQLDEMEDERENRKEKQLDKLIGIFAKLAEKPN